MSEKISLDSSDLNNYKKIFHSWRKNFNLSKT